MPVLLALVIGAAEVGISGAQPASGRSASESTIVAKKSPTPTKKPKPTATPTPEAVSGSSLDLQGQGALIPESCACADALSVIVGCFCTGTFTSSLTGPPFGQIDLNFDLSVDPTPFTSGPSCYQASGGGELGPTGDQNIGFTGELCAESYMYSLQGTLEIFPTQACQVPQTVMVGTLAAFGAVHQTGPVPTAAPSPAPLANPIPSGANSSALVSIIGTVGQIAAPCPSP